MFDRQLAKWHLERQGFFAAVDVSLGTEGNVDVFGFQVGPGSHDAVFGVVRGWWHAGGYLTPSLIRGHLQTERKLLDRAFSPERLAAAARHFNLPRPPEKVLFFSKRSPSLAEEAEAELEQIGVRVVYLEDILADALAEVKSDERMQGSVFQVLAMVKSSRIFKEMARRARAGETRTVAPDRPVQEQTDLQLNLLLSLEEEDEDGDHA